MSVEWIDGFDHYTTANANTVYTVSGTATITATNSRTGLCLTLTNGDYVSHSLAATTTKYIGFGFRTPSFATQNAIASFSFNGSVQVELRVNTNGTLSAYNGSGTLLATTPLVNAMSTDTYYYIEFGVSCLPTLGVININIDGTSRAAVSSLNTDPQGSTIANSFKLSASAARTSLFDDLYVSNRNGAAPHNTFLGPHRVESLYPNADGYVNQFTASAGDRYACVDEAQGNGSTDYVSSDTPGDRQSFDIGALSGPTQQVTAVQLAAQLETDNGRTARLVIRPTIVNKESGVLTLTASWKYYGYVWQVNPQTGGLWSVADIAETEIGIKVEA